MRAPALVCVVLALIVPNSGAAGDGGIVIWNERIAATLGAAAVAEGVCRGMPERGLNHRCAAQELNRNRTPFVVVTLLDEIALLAARYANPAVGGTIAPNMNVEFVAHSTNIFTEGVEAHLYLKVEW